MIRWLALIGALWLLWQRLAPRSTESAPQRSLAVDVCVGLTLAALVGALIFDASWLGLVAFAAAFFGLAFALKQALRRGLARLRRLLGFK